MGVTLTNRPTSQQFDPTFQTAGFNTLAGNSSSSAVYNPFLNPAGQPQPLTPQMAQPAQAAQPAATVPKQVVPRTIGTAYQMPRWGVTSAGFRGLPTSPLRRASL